MTKSTKINGSIACVAMILIFSLFAPAFAADKDDKKEKSKPTSTNNTSTLAAQKVGKDADGAVRPTTPAEENKLNAELKKTLNKYPKHSAKQNPDGSLSLVVAPHYLGLAIATIDADGNVKVSCSDAEQESQKNVNHKHELPEE